MKLTLSKRKLLLLSPVPLAALLLFGLPAILASSGGAKPRPDLGKPINPKDVTIVRDEWGVPHIYGKTDADAAYGLAWANAEDDFETMQHSLLAVHGRLGSVTGKDGAMMDFAAFLFDVKGVVEQKYETDISPEFKRILNAYAQAVNRFAALHPDEVLRKGVFPIHPKDMVEGYVLGMLLMTNVHFDLIRIFGNTTGVYDQYFAQRKGSNAIAMNAGKTADDKTYLAVNSHQPMEGAYAWYECHVNSEEGWNVLGGTFPGGAMPFLGVSENLGWAHTVNFADNHDVYRLEMHPGKKLHYRFDGEWLELEKRRKFIWVKFGFLKMPVWKTFYRSVHGPVIKNESGYYALRASAAMGVGAAEQWYRMNKATGWASFNEALGMQAHAGLNVVYADKDGVIHYLSNGHFPKRDPNYNWLGMLPGDTSATLWQPDFLPLDELVQVHNPDCGYVFNMNNTPFSSTCQAECPNPSNHDPTIGYLTKNTARSLRFMELMEAYGDKINYDEFKKIKYDRKYPTPVYARNWENLQLMLELDPAKHPDLADVIEIGKKWDRKSNVDNPHAAVFAFAIKNLIEYAHSSGTLDIGHSLPEEVYANALRDAKSHMLKHFGTLDLTLGEVQVHARKSDRLKNKKEIPIGGLPEVLATTYGEDYRDGKLRAAMGETYIMMARYNDQGLEQLETVNCYGASNRPGSPHYEDQMELFVNQQLKTMTLDKDEIFKNARRIYHPGGGAVLPDGEKMEVKGE